MCGPMAGVHRASQHVLGRDRNIPPNDRLSIDGSVVDHRREGSSGTGKGDPVGWTFVHGFPAPMCQARRASRQPSVYILPGADFTLHANAGASRVDAGCINMLSCVTSELICGFNAHENSDMVELHGIHFCLLSNQRGRRCYLSRISALWNSLLLDGWTTPENDSSAMRMMGTANALLRGR